MLNSTGMTTSALHPSWFIMAHLGRGCFSTRPLPCQFVTVRRQWESESPTLLNLFLPDFGFKMLATHCFGAILACVLLCCRHWGCSYCHRHRSSHHFYQVISSEQTQKSYSKVQTFTPKAGAGPARPTAHGFLQVNWEEQYWWYQLAWNPGSVSGRDWDCGCWGHRVCSCDSHRQCCWSCSGHWPLMLRKAAAN